MMEHRGTWTPEQIHSLLVTNDRAVERAIVVIFNRQTTDEQATKQTRHRNFRGFQTCDAKRGSYWARWILAGNHLTGDHLYFARRMAIKYRRQLADEANLRAQETA
jgi:hypothetical protein